MGLIKGTCATSKPEIPEKAKNEAKLLFQHQILSYVEQYSILPSLIMNFDQIPLNYARFLTARSYKRIQAHGLGGSSFKEAITATFGITMERTAKMSTGKTVKMSITSLTSLRTSLKKIKAGFC